MIKFVLFNTVLLTIASVCYTSGDIAVAALMFGITVTNMCWWIQLYE